MLECCHCDVFFVVWFRWLQGVANVESGGDAAMKHTKANATKKNEACAVKIDVQATQR